MEYCNIKFLDFTNLYVVSTKLDCISFYTYYFMIVVRTFHSSAANAEMYYVKVIIV